MATVTADHLHLPDYTPNPSAFVAQGTDSAPTADVAPATPGGPQRLALSIAETAALLGVSEKSVRRLIDRGLIRPSRALRHIRIPRWEVDRFLRDSLSPSWRA